MQSDTASAGDIDWFAELEAGTGRAADLGTDLRGALAMALHERARERAEAIRREREALAHAEQVREEERREAERAARAAAREAAARQRILEQKVARAERRTVIGTIVIGWAVQSLLWWSLLTRQGSLDSGSVGMILFVPAWSLPVLWFLGWVFSLLAVRNVRIAHQR